jgi:hypothetical protein
VEIREEEYTIEFGEECDSMFVDHLNEVQMIREEPWVDHITYVRASQRGDLALVVARDNGRVVGYLGFWIINDPNHMSVQAQQAGFYLLEEYRKGFTAVKMIKEAERVLKENFDVGAVLLVSTIKKDISPLFRYLDYQEAETTYIKEI